MRSFITATRENNAKIGNKFDKKKTPPAKWHSMHANKSAVVLAAIEECWCTPLDYYPTSLTGLVSRQYISLGNARAQVLVLLIWWWHQDYCWPLWGGDRVANLDENVIYILQGDRTTSVEVQRDYVEIQLCQVFKWKLSLPRAVKSSITLLNHSVHLFLENTI